MSRSFEGGCACGAIRYKASAEPAFVAHCHCKDCQKMTGAQMATVAGVAADAFSLEQGEPKVYITKGDSGANVYRSFCSNCGSTLFSTADAMAGMYFVEAGSLDDASWLEPTSHIYTSSAQPWARIPEDMAQFPKLPPAA
jgi:hypothetical protein